MAKKTTVEEQANTDLDESRIEIVTESGLRVACDTSRRTHRGSMEIQGIETTLYQTNRGAISAEGPFELVAEFIADAELVKALRIDKLSKINKLTGEKTFFIDVIASSVGLGPVGNHPVAFRLSLGEVVPRDDNGAKDDLAGADMSATADDWVAPEADADEE